MIKQNDPRRWKERADARMVQEDHAAMANLSNVFMQKEIPHHALTYGPGDSPYGPGALFMELKESFFDGAKRRR